MAKRKSCQMTALLFFYAIEAVVATQHPLQKNVVPPSCTVTPKANKANLIPFEDYL